MKVLNLILHENAKLIVYIQNQGSTHTKVPDLALQSTSWIECCVLSKMATTLQHVHHFHIVHLIYAPLMNHKIYDSIQHYSCSATESSALLLKCTQSAHKFATSSSSLSYDRSMHLSHIIHLNYAKNIEEHSQMTQPNQSMHISDLSMHIANEQSNSQPKINRKVAGRGGRATLGRRLCSPWELDDGGDARRSSP